MPTNEDGDYLLNVGEKVKATIYVRTASDNFILTLRSGEAYRLELYDPFVNDRGHSHAEFGGTAGAITGPIEVDPTSNSLNSNSALTHNHYQYHISLGSITQVANGRTIQSKSSSSGPSVDVWRVFWDGTLLKSCCDAGNRAHVFHAPAAGDYRIQVNTDYGPTQYGSKVTRIPDQPEIPSFRARHGLFTQGYDTFGHHASVLGNIGVGDKDWFAVKLEGGKSYRVSLAASNLGWQGLSNPRFVAMAGPDGVQVQPNFEGRRDRFRLNLPRDEGGYYHFGVSGASASDRGLYVFSIVEEDFPANPNAPVVDVGQQIIGMIESNSDVDWIGAQLEAGRTYRIKVSGSYGDIHGRSFARFVKLGSTVYNTNGMSIRPGAAFRMESAADHGGNVNYLGGQIASARWSVASSGRYFFQVVRSEKTAAVRGAYYFQITDITP